MSFKESLETTQQRLTSVRDIALVVGAGLYLLGYIAWSLYAWHMSLGLLPVLSTQYVVAGAIIGVFLAIAAAYIWSLFLLTKAAPQWKGKFGRRRAAATYWLGFAFFLPMGGLVIAGDYYNISHMMIVPVFVLFVCAPALVSLGSTSSPMVHKRRLSIFMGIVLPIVALAFAIVSFLHLPQQSGGVHPQCVRLDIERKMLSSELQAALLIPANANSNKMPKVQETLPLDLLFERADALRVRLPSHPDVYFIDSKIVRAMVSC